MTIRELCKYIGITTPTLYNWKKEKPNLYDIVMNFNNNQNNLDKEVKEIIKLFRQLSENEKKYYIKDIEARILKKEIDK